MTTDNVLPLERVSRYNLIIVFEELYTQDTTQLQVSADAIGVVANAIQTLISTDMSLQTLLEMQNLKLQIIAPARCRHAGAPFWRNEGRAANYRARTTLSDEACPGNQFWPELHDVEGRYEGGSGQ